MSNWAKAWRKFLADTRGVFSVEYTLIVTASAIAAAALLANPTRMISGVWNNPNLQKTAVVGGFAPASSAQPSSVGCMAGAHSLNNAISRTCSETNTRTP